MSDDESFRSKRFKQDDLSRSRKKSQRQALHQSQDILPIVTPVQESSFIDSDSDSALPQAQEVQAIFQSERSVSPDIFMLNPDPSSLSPREPCHSNITQGSSSKLISSSSPDGNVSSSSERECHGDPSSPDDSDSSLSESEGHGDHSDHSSPGYSDPSSSERDGHGDHSDHSSPDESDPSSSDQSESSSSDSSEPSDDEETDVENDDNTFTPAEGILENNEFQNEIIIREQDDPVCPCTNITVGEILFMALSIAFRHVLSFNAIIDHLKMLNTIFKREVIPPTLYNLLKFAEPDRSQDLYHIYCPECSVYLTAMKEEHLLRQISCGCGWQIDKAKNADSFFMSLGMESQLKKLLETADGIAESLKYRFARQKINEDALEDVYDGNLYKKLSAPGEPLSKPENISFSWNTDGVPYGKTSYQQIYPIYVMINELPPKLRVKSMLMVGIYVGKKKPNMQVMLQPFVEECNKLSSVGFDWQHNGEKVHTQVIPICCCVDSQERYKLLNHKAFSGYFGCTFCEHRGEHVRKHGMRYGLLENAPEIRTHESMKQNMLEAHEQNFPVKGCKGLSPLINLQHFDLALGPVPDFLHYSEGVVNQHLNHLLSQISEEDILNISARALKITTPSAVSRTPRALKYREKFTASEWRSFLVTYGPVVMKDIVPDKYVAHFALLSSAMHILLQKSVTVSQLQYCDELLIMYCIYFEKYFGLEKMTYNVHLLLHVVNGVLNHGPVWTHTCYPYEGKNKEILGWAKSPFRVAKGVARKYSMHKNLPNLASRFGVCDTVLEYSTGLHAKRLWVAVRNGNCSILGKGTECQLQNNDKIAVQQLLGELRHEHEIRVVQYDQMMVGGIIFSTDSYGWSTRKSDSGVYLKDSSKCVVKKILEVTDGHYRGKIIVLVQKKILDQRALWRKRQLSVRHIREVVGNGAIYAIYPFNIGGQCMFMEVDNRLFATCLPYGCVGD